MAPWPKPPPKEVPAKAATRGRSLTERKSRKQDFPVRRSVRRLRQVA